MVHSLSEVWSAAATPPLWLSSQLTVGKKHPLLRPAQPKAKAPPLAAHSKWHRPISKMTHYRRSWLFDYDGTLHLAVMNAAALAAFELEGTGLFGSVFNGGRFALIELDTTVLDAFDFKSVRPVQGCNFKTNYGADRHFDARRREFEFLCGHLHLLHVGSEDPIRK